MGTFLVFRQLPGVTRDQYRAAQVAAMHAAGQSAVGGRIVRYRSGMLIQANGRAICIFEADSLDDVITVNERAGVPFTEVVEAVELRPDTTNPCRARQV